MSEPIRYNVKCGDKGYQIAESLGGEWVRYGDYARLKAEVERLRKDSEYERKYREVLAVLKENNL